MLTDANMLDIYIDFLICSTSHTTATALSRTTENAVSHDKITRFLSKRDYTSQDLWQFAKPLIKSVQNEKEADGDLIIDDTIVEKPYTDENDIISWHFDHSKGRSVKGINIVSALYKTDAASIPVAYEVVKKTQHVVNEKTGKKGRKSPISKQQHCRNLIETSRSNNVNFKRVLADVWYASAENMRFIVNDMHKEFIMPLKENRKVALSEEKLAAGEFVGIKKLELGKSILVRLEGVDFPLRLTRQVFKNEDGSTGVLYLVSSNIELTGAQIETIYQRRWKVEEYHKSLKNNTSIAKSPTKTVKTQANHLFASICAFIRLEAIHITTKLNHFALKDKIYIEALKTALRELEKLKSQNFTSGDNKLCYCVR
jgi:hypothetical protein